MYKDLSLKEKAKVIREGVRLGLNSIDDIQSLYDEAISYQQEGPIVSPYGQWQYPGKDTIIPSNNITMDNVNYPVLGISDAGDAKVMMPWNDYKFRGSMVYEHPLIDNQFQLGGLAKPFSYGDIPDVRYQKGGNIFQNGEIINRIKPIEEYITPIEPSVQDNTYVVRNYPYYLLPEVQDRNKRLSDEELSDYYASNILWTMENPKHKGLNSDGTYSAYEDEAGFNFGPGLHAKSNNLDINKTYTKQELDSIASNIALNYMKQISEDLETMQNGRYAGARDTLSAGPLLTMLDIAYNVKPKNKGNMPQKWPNLTDSLINGNIEKAKENTYSGSTRRQKMRNQMIVYKPLEGITIHNQALGGNLFAIGGPKKKLKSPEDILAEKYGVEPVVDNTNYVQQQAFTPQEKSYAAAQQEFYERHKSPETEDKVLREARQAVKDQKAAEFGTLDTPQSSNLQYAWRRFNNSKGSELLYPLPGIGEAMFGVDVADKLYSGNYSDAVKDLALYGAMTYAPEILNIAKNYRFTVPKNPNRYYRIVDKRAIDDYANSGIIRSAAAAKDAGTNTGDNLKGNVGKFLLAKNHDYVMFSKGKPWEGGLAVRDKGKPYILRSKKNTGNTIWEQSNIDFRHKGHEGIYRPRYNGSLDDTPSYFFEYWEPLKIGYMRHEFPFSKGGSIHIKPENRGKFTALKKRTGHSASWFKAHGTPAQRKMATFELNSRHWNKHALGGYLEGGIYDLPEEEIKRLISLGYEVEYL